MKINRIKIAKVIKKPSLIFQYLAYRGKLKFIPDKLYLKLLFRIKMNRKLDLNNPKTYNEKLQWLKLYDRNPMYTNLVDKYEVRKFVAEKIGSQYLIPIYGVYNSFEEIDFDKLPNQFVLKCTHDSGGIIICKDKNNLNIEEAKKKLNRSLKSNYYWKFREWPYKHVKPRIICEKYMVDESGEELKDYKFFCFNGIPKVLYVASNRGVDTRFDFFDLNFNKLPIIKNKYKNSQQRITKPENFEKMIKLSKVLSEGIPHVRVDFYNINGKIYFGELTFYHFSGLEMFFPEKYDEIFGKWLELPKI